MGVVEVVRVPCLLHSIFTHSSLIRETEREVSETELYFKKKKGAVCFNEKLSNMTILKRKESSVEEG